MREKRHRPSGIVCAAAVALAATAAGLAGCAAMSSSTDRSGSSAQTVESVTATKHVQRQPPAGACHARGSGLYSLPDAHCTPGAISSAVTQANIHSTICVSGYTKKVRPRESITRKEKLASMDSYGDSKPPHYYEYDHLVSLELGGAPNDPRNLWPEPGASPNPKDRLEDRLHALVCDGQMTLASARRQVAGNWVTAYHRLFG